MTPNKETSDAINITAGIRRTDFENKIHGAIIDHLLHLEKTGEIKDAHKLSREAREIVGTAFYAVNEHVKDHNAAKHLEKLRDKLWKANKELVDFAILAEALDAFGERVEQVDRKAIKAKTQIADAILDLTTEIKRLRRGS